MSGWARQDAALFGPYHTRGPRIDEDEALARRLQREEEQARTDEALARHLQDEDGFAPEPPSEPTRDVVDVGEIRRVCRAANQLFVDVSFGETSWKRPEEIQRIEIGGVPRRHRRSDFCVVRSDPRPEDVIQGSGGNCYYISTVAAVVATAPECIKTLFVDIGNRDTDFGAHGVRLCVGGRWRVVVIDERFPVRGDGWTTMTQLAFATSRRLQLFPQLLEKAFAKVCGGYDRLHGGVVHEALALLTGCPCENVKFEDIDDATLWATLLSAKEAGFIICAATKGALITGDLAPHHAYAVVDVLELYNPPAPLGDGARNRLLTLVNPHGPGSPFVWRGAWSDNDSRWRPETRALVFSKRIAGSSSFFMSLDDVRRHFHVVTICEYRRDWTDARIPFRFEKTTLGFQVDVFSKGTEATFEVALPLARARSDNSAVVDAGLLVLNNKKLVASAPSETTANPTARCHVDASCLLIPLSFNEHTSDATLVARSSAPVLLKPVTVDPAMRRRAILLYVRECVVTSNSCLRIYQRRDPSVCYVAAENFDPMRRTLRMTVSVLHRTGVSLSRCSSVPDDVPVEVCSEIPPGHIALVLVVAAHSAQQFSYQLQHQCTLVARGLFAQRSFMRLPFTGGSTSDFSEDNFVPPLRDGPSDLHTPIPSGF